MVFVDDTQQIRDAWENGGRKAHKLELIRLHRRDLLKQTDEFALSDRAMSDEMKNYRQNLRDIPQNYTTEEQLDELMAKDETGLTHAVWRKP
jgi:hypothetical protein